MGGHSLSLLLMVVVFASGVAAFFAVSTGSLKPLANAMSRSAGTQSNLALLRGALQKETARKKLRIDAETSAARPSRESLETSRNARADLLAADPGFDPETFLRRAEAAYVLVKRALILGDTAPLRAYVHPSFYALTVAEAERIAASGIRARAAGITVERVFAQSVETSAAGDRIWVHFDIKTRARNVDAQSGDVVADLGTSTGFGEQCLFVRNAGLKTVACGGVFAQKCPACAEPLALSSDARCVSCREEVSTGAHDWTLAAAVPVPYDNVDVDVLVDETLLDPAAGFAALRAADPAFSESALQERVAKAFGALETALKTGELESVRAFMSPGLFLAWSLQAEEARAARNTMTIEGTEILKLEPASVRRGESFDDVTMRIDGVRARFVLDERGRMLSGSKERTAFSELWTLQRCSNVTSSGAPGACESRCPNCGASVSINAAGECPHCNALIADGAFDWVLCRIVDADAGSMLVRAG